MNDPGLFADLDAAIADELGRLKKLPVSLLQFLSREGVTGVIRVRARAYEIKAWSVPVSVAAGSFAVLVGAFEPDSSGPTHVRGFLVKPDQTCTDLTERELRSYD
jgi:hypothetical protein